MTSRRPSHGSGHTDVSLSGRPIRSVVGRRFGLLIALIGFAGGLVMSPVKRDRGIKDYGSVIVDPGGVMDRIYSL